MYSPSLEASAAQTQLRQRPRAVRAACAPRGGAPEQRRSSRRCSAPLPLTRCSCARAGARQLPGRWRGVSGVDVDLLIAPLPAGVRVTAGLGGVTWRSRRLAVLTAGCSALLLATSHAGQPHPAGASERHPPALLLRLKKLQILTRPAPSARPRASLAGSGPDRPLLLLQQRAAILDQADGSDGPLVCSCRAQPVV